MKIIILSVGPPFRGGISEQTELLIESLGIENDVLLVNFNLKTDTARVHQKLLWIWKRNWSFNLEESDSIHVWARKGILFQRLAPTYHVALSRFDAPTLHLGKYPTLKEAEAIAHPLLRLLDVPIEEGPPTPPERD